MARRRKDDGGSGSLDSLLDTMTNVVGILVILLAVTQLGVRDAVKRISVKDQVAPEELEAALSAVTEAVERRQQLESQLDAFAEFDSQVTLAELQRLLRLVADLEADLVSLTGVKSSDLAEIEKKIAEAKRRLKEQREKEKELETILNQRQDQLAKLESQLEDTPVRRGPAPKVVYLPNPRKAPEAAKPISFVCRDGKIAWLDLGKYQNRAQLWTANAVQSKPIYGNLKTGIDCGKLFAAYNRNNFRDANFEYRLIARGRYPFLEMSRRERWGEEIEEINGNTSKYAQIVQAVNPRLYYFQFLVWPDSFEIYLKARQIAQKRRILAGWKTIGSPGEYQVRLTGKLLCGPPPKPKPAPAKPVQPRPATPPPPPPDDTID